jgi:hypothetical protein
VPLHYETKPCSVHGCSGTMIHGQRVVPVAGASVVREDGKPQRIERRPGWICDRNRAHTEWDEPSTP